MGPSSTDEGRGPNRPPIGPEQAFVLFVTWSALGIIATALMILFFSRSVPFWITAIGIGT